MRSFMGRTFLYADRGYIMRKDIPGKIIDITGIELRPESRIFVLATGSRALRVVATSATTICFVFPNMTPNPKN